MSLSPGMQFHRTQLADGAWASFCIRCLRLVASDIRDPNLIVEAEAAHTCDPATVARLREKHIRP